MFFKPNICLVLGGGGARGLLHLGVLKVLEQYNLIPGAIVGTSMGAIVGGAYASGQYDIIELIELFESMLNSREFEKLSLNIMDDSEDNKKISFLHKFKNSIAKYKFYRKMFNSKYLISSKLFENFLNLVMPDKKIEELPIKFAAVALDLINKEELILNKGSLRKAVLASSAIPGIIEPVRMGDRLLADGGWIDKVPVPAAHHLNARKVIAVDVSKRMKKTQELKNGFQTMRVAENITAEYLKNLQVLSADLLLQPELDTHWYDFHEFKELVQAGEKLALTNINKISRIFGKRNIFDPLAKMWQWQNKGKK